jgi:hypothetical protein
MAHDALIIDSYLAALATRLPGPRRARDAVIDELRDGLSELAARYTDTGRPPRAAAEAAVAEFGTVDQVAAAFAGELITRQARQIIAALIITGPLVGVWWLLLLTPAGIPTLPLIGAAVLTGLLVLATTGGLARWLPSTAPARALTGATTVVVACIAGDVGMLTTLAIGSNAELGVVAVVAVLASLVRLGCGVQLLRACLSARRALSSP